MVWLAADLRKLWCSPKSVLDRFGPPGNPLRSGKKKCRERVETEVQMSGDTIGTTASAIAIVSAVISVFVYADRLNGRVSQLEEQVHSLAASSAATASALAEATRKPAVAVNLIQRKYAELADEAHTGQRNDGMGTHASPEVSKNALMSMEKLGCGSTVR